MRCPPQMTGARVKVLSPESQCRDLRACFCLLLPFLRPGGIQLFFGFCVYISTTFLY